MQNVNNICNFFSSRFANKKMFAFQLFAVTCLLAFFLTYRMSKKSFHQDFNLVKTSECQGVRTPDWCSHRGQCQDQALLTEATLSPCPSCCHLPPLIWGMSIFTHTGSHMASFILRIYFKDYGSIIFVRFNLCVRWKLPPEPCAKTLLNSQNRPLMLNCYRAPLKLHKLSRKRN